MQFEIQFTNFGAVYFIANSTMPIHLTMKAGCWIEFISGMPTTTLQQVPLMVIYKHIT